MIYYKVYLFEIFFFFLPNCFLQAILQEEDVGKQLMLQEVHEAKEKSFELQVF